jgi:glyceraldehyde 3-phosphate dehydrogenase
MKMAVKLAINGFGRIGRLVFRAALEQGGVDLVGINDLANAKSLAHLLKYDSVHGTLKNDVSHDEKNLIVDGKKVPVFSEKDPAALPWDSVGAQIVVESTGIFTKREGAAKHLKGSVKKVIISAPSGDADAMIVMGVNDDTYDPVKHHVVSNASCTTNCLAPFVKVLNDNWGIVNGLMTTIHAFTNDQPSQDQIHSDFRRMRAASLSMIPTKTGAAAAIGKVIPALNGKLDGYAMRVPTPNVSATDLTANLAKPATKEEINAALKAAADGPLKGILGYSDEPLVSIDYNHCALSSVVDGQCTKVIDGTFVKVLSWYDNEWGYSCRVIDLAKKMAASL